VVLAVAVKLRVAVEAALMAEAKHQTLAGVALAVAVKLPVAAEAALMAAKPPVAVAARLRCRGPE